VYQKQTAPVVQWYQRDGARLLPVDAVGSTSEVLNRALTALGR
jgi:adenylate kinase family enzyme